MSRNKLVKGAIKSKDWYFQKTSSPLKRGSRFLTDDRPDETAFRNLFEGIGFKGEVTDKAYEDDPSKPLSEKQGFVVLATDEQAKVGVVKSDNIARVVQPSQLPEVVGEGDIIVEIDPTVTTKNKYKISADITSVIPVEGGVDLSYDIPIDTDVVVVYDTTSFIGPSLTSAKERITSWFASYRNDNPNYQGRMLEISTGVVNSNLRDASEYLSQNIQERFVLFPKEYIESNWKTADRITSNEGVVTTSVEIGTVTNKKCMFVIFEDEADPIYYIGSSVLSQSPTSLYQTDYAAFIASSSQFDFFKTIVYPAKGSGGETSNANFHSLLTKTITNGTWATNLGLTVMQDIAGYGSDAMDFMDTANPFIGYDNLTSYGWSSTEYDLKGDGEMGSISQAQFNLDMENALQDSGEDHQRVTITNWIKMSDGSTLYFEPYSLNVKK